MVLVKKLSAEFVGTLWLVLGGCGSAVFAAAFPQLGIGFTGVSLAFGLTVLTMAYAVGHISGGHFNPAVTFGLWAGKRFPANEIVPYIIAQVLGAIAGAAIIYAIATGKAGFAIDATKAGAFATNGFDAFSPGGYSLAAAFIAEVVLTFAFLVIILGSTHKKAPGGFCTNRYRSRFDTHSFDFNSDNQYISQSGTKHWRGSICRRNTINATLAVLARTDSWRNRCRIFLFLDVG